jgi:hypothetical protein
MQPNPTTCYRCCSRSAKTTSPAPARPSTKSSTHSYARDITGGPGWLIDMLALTRRRLQSGTQTQAL